ncbi:trypsin-like peptidase domain-containing protein [Candidatus Nitrosotenuis chungbukensis]|uniref:S1C family serine protease n=1 Tax=Candidatus Nitrosotenuis chungbukensis TaxID=1353246 RepID=UPI00069468E3|nr:trypsin-like peptidase domain-containing protein [Candidatus Nitrosotenuis chungbukensis]WKT57258.1 trypsin-like peptidase domain-containing protein [Candidatus Nitrosotenuis chungbukensis]
MNRSNAIISGLLGVVIILVAYSIILNPPQKTPTVEDIGKATKTVVGDQTSQDLTLTEIFEKTESGVVKINVKRPNDQRGNGLGSGFVYDREGHIITNDHVIENAEKITVTFLDGRSFKANLVGKDLYTDLAVLKVNASEDALYPLTLGNSSKLKVGEQIAAIGNPFGLSGSMTSGIVSQIGRLLPSQDRGFQIPDIVQTDAAINPGNSGGPLLNMRGEVVGINTAIQSETGDFAGVGFAIPSRTVQKIIPTLIEKNTYHHPWVGISGRDIDPDLAEILKIEDTRGFLIINVLKDSPAEKAGLRGTTNSTTIDGVTYQVGGDIVLAVDGITVRKIDDILIHLQRDKTVGDEMALQILRDGRVTSLVLTLEERPNASVLVNNTTTNSTQK